MDTNLIGEFGVSLTALLLNLKYDLKVTIERNRESRIDLKIDSPQEGTGFKKRTHIQVITRGKRAETIPPSSDEVRSILKELEQDGIDFWIGLVRYRFTGTSLQFKIFLLPAKELDLISDFKGQKKEIDLKSIMDKKTLEFESEMPLS